MKKTYIAPKTELMEVAVESLLAASTITVDRNSVIENETNFLSNEGSGWNSDCWSE